MVRVLIEADARRVLHVTVTKPKSVLEISEELAIPVRSVYRHVNDLCDLGLLTSERRILIDSGGKYALYRSMVKSVTFTYESEGNLLEVDLIPNENLLEKFMRFWSYMGG